MEDQEEKTVKGKNFVDEAEVVDYLDDSSEYSVIDDTFVALDSTEDISNKEYYDILAKTNQQKLLYHITEADKANDNISLSEALESLGEYGGINNLGLFTDYLDHTTPIVVESAMLAIEYQLLRITEKLGEIKSRGSVDGLSAVAESILYRVKVRCL
jgi:endonuclease IV